MGFCGSVLLRTNYELRTKQEICDPRIIMLSCFSFSFSSATMATAPYNYSYIFKYIIIGKSKAPLETPYYFCYSTLPDAVDCSWCWDNRSCGKKILLGGLSLPTTSKMKKKRGSIFGICRITPGVRGSVERCHTMSQVTDALFGALSIAWS